MRPLPLKYRVSLHTPDRRVITTQATNLCEVAQLLHGVKGTFFVFHRTESETKMTYHTAAFDSWDGDEVEEIREAIKQLD